MGIVFYVQYRLYVNVNYTIMGVVCYVLQALLLCVMCDSQKKPYQLQLHNLHEFISVCVYICLIVMSCSITVCPLY